jgi:dCTP deaminase
MFLSSDEIVRRVHDGGVAPADRLIITPVFAWKTQASQGKAAVDLRLGQAFTIPRRTKLDRLDPVASTHNRDRAIYKDEHHVSIGDYFVLHPGQFVLGETLEWIHLPADLTGIVTCRSSWGRDGLVIATATGIHPRYSGVLTLEITNLGEIPLRLYPGLRVAQLFLASVHQAATTTVVPSSFTASTGPSSGDPAGEDRFVIAALAKMRGIAE